MGRGRANRCGRRVISQVSEDAQCAVADLGIRVFDQPTELLLELFEQSRRELLRSQRGELDPAALILDVLLWRYVLEPVMVLRARQSFRRSE